MSPISQPEFTRLLARLGPSALERFIADLWQARGFRIDSDEEGVLIATRNEPAVEEHVLQVIHRRAGRFGSTPTIRDDADLVIAVDPIKAGVTGLSDRSGVSLLDADELYKIALYGVDRDELDELFRTHFGRSLTPDQHGHVARWHVRDVLPPPLGTGYTTAPLRAIVVGIVVVGLVVAYGSAVVTTPADTTAVSGEAGFGDGTGSGLPSGTTEPPSTDRPAETPSQPISEPRFVGPCSTPPTDAPPWDLRPPVIQSPSPPGVLEGWQISGEEKITISRVRAESLRSEGRMIPELKYRATYTSPTWKQYRIDISQWDSTATAENFETVRAPRFHALAAWGHYTIGVNGYTMNGTELSRETARPTAVLILSQVKDPNGSKLGTECVSFLLGNDTVNRFGA